jgi:hypothetical protein
MRRIRRKALNSVITGLQIRSHGTGARIIMRLSGVYLFIGRTVFHADVFAGPEPAAAGMHLNLDNVVDISYITVKFRYTW